MYSIAYPFGADEAAKHAWIRGFYEASKESDLTVAVAFTAKTFFTRELDEVTVGEATTGVWDMDNCLCAANESAKHTGLKVQPWELQTMPQINDRSGPTPASLAKMVESNNLMPNIKLCSKQNAPNAVWAAGAGAEEGGAPSDVAEVVTETALTRLETTLIDPRLVGAPYPSPTTEPSGVGEPVGAPLSPEHSNGLDDGELPAGTVTVVETRLQRLKRTALFSAKLLAAKSASGVTSETMGTMWTKMAGRRSARLTSSTETGGDNDTATDGGTTQGTVEGLLTLAADRLDGAAPLTLPGRPTLCGDVDRCGQTQRFQSGGFGHCCGRCFEAYAEEHSEHCGWYPTPPPDTAESEATLNDITPATMHF